MQPANPRYILWFESLSRGNVALAGGQAPSNYPEFAAYLVECGIDSISLNPDSFVTATRRVAQAEQQRSKVREAIPA